MTRMKLLCAAFALAAIVAAAPAANAQAVVHYLGAGSSAMFQGFAVAAVNDLGPIAKTPGGSIHHWSVKTSSGGSCGGTCAQLVDSRTSGATTVPNEAGNLWVAWTADSGGHARDIWAYLAVDSTVGVRVFLAQPRVKLLVDAATKTTQPGVNAISPLLFTAGVNSATSGCGALTTCDDVNIPSDVWTALGGATGQALTAGMTDIRAEDAKYATKRALGALNTVNFSGLGYANSSSALVATTPFKSGTGTSTAKATPVNFGLPGYSDPFNTALTVPKTIVQLAVGEAPILFIVNRQNSVGLGTRNSAGQLVYTDALDYWPPTGVPSKYPIHKIFGGKDCEGNSAAFSGGAGAILGNPVLPSLVTVTGVSSVVAGTSTTYTYNAQTQGFPLDATMRIVISGFGNANNNGNFAITATGVGTITTNNTHGVVTSGKHASGIAAYNATTPSNTVGSMNNGNFPINAVQREALSGTMNTTEFTEFRLYGGPTGSANGAIPAPTAFTQEQNVGDPTVAANNPLHLKPCVIGLGGTVGTRSRAIGTGEEVGGAGGAGGVKFLTDGLGYTFFSFGNVSTIGGSNNWGYLTLDGVDGLFNNYVGTGSDPGQPSGNVAGADPGQIPVCTPGGSATVPDCLATAIWQGGNSYPHLRDGTYRSWSELRLLCDVTVDPTDHTQHCLSSQDTLGAEALLINLQNDIHNSHFGGVPDLLPFSEDGSNGTLFPGYCVGGTNPGAACTTNAQCTGGGQCLITAAGDAGFVREHYNFLVGDHNNPSLQFKCPSQADNTADNSGPECGGDAGGFIKPVGTNATGVFQ